MFHLLYPHLCWNFSNILEIDHLRKAMDSTTTRRKQGGPSLRQGFLFIQHSHENFDDNTHIFY